MGRSIRFCAATVRCPWCGLTVARLWWEYTEDEPIEDGSMLIFEGTRAHTVANVPRLGLHATMGRDGDNTTPKWCPTPESHGWALPVGVEQRIRAAAREGRFMVTPIPRREQLTIRARRARRAPGVHSGP